MADRSVRGKRARARSPWWTSSLTLGTTLTAILFLAVIVHSFLNRQLDEKGCHMSYMRPAYAKLEDFDTEHTRFASKYSVYLYREVDIDEDTRVKGVPVLFIPGNAGSYKQVRPIAAAAAQHYHDVIRHDRDAYGKGTRSLDFFTVDFNEDITAFHGQTLLDQAEYLNEAVAFILSLYHDTHRSTRDPDLPDPTSVILLGHSMGGVVARTMLTMPNFQSNSINTIITMSAPHARPPVSFDSDIVQTYKHINDYWRDAYSQKWASNNPLWHVTLVSIAGGGLDTVVPSDYASLSSLVPETHGFTVFTSTIPNIWTGVDHQEITWCDQFRKAVAKSLLDVVDVQRPGQTKPRAERMRIFKKWFLTGMEAITEKTLPQKAPTTLLTMEDNSNSILSQGQRLVLRSFGRSKKARAYLLPIPPLGTADRTKFTLLSNQKLDEAGENGKLEVLFCSVFPLQGGQASTLFSMNMDLSGDSSGSTRLACKNAATDTIPLPASTSNSKYPFDDGPPFSYLQYNLKDLTEHQFIAVVDKAVEQTPGWAIAEFSSEADSIIQTDVGLWRLLTMGMHLTLSASRSLMTVVKVPAMHSSLLAYTLTVGHRTCGDQGELFTPLLRQYLTEPYESKYFVNVKQANINLHGIAPFLPPPLRSSNGDGLSLQFWTDPSCETSMDISLKLDLAGSMGKLFMRYRTIFAAFPLLVVALVLRKQFKVYDRTGIFISFSEALDESLRKSLPLALLVLSVFAISLSQTRTPASPESSSLANGILQRRNNATETPIDFTRNDLLIGSPDSLFWFLVPLFGIVSVGICFIVNYITLIVVHLLHFLYSLLVSSPSWLVSLHSSSTNNHGIMSSDLPNRQRQSGLVGFNSSSPRRRIISTAILLFFVATVIPYQFAYMVACIVQIATCIRALHVARENSSLISSSSSNGTSSNSSSTTNTSSTASSSSLYNYNFYNYVHSVLVLMLWVLPINLPVLVVWIHNLAVHWLTPFSSHHNVLSITPVILLVETLASGQMAPRVTSRLRHVAPTLLSLLAAYAAIYGVTYAYLLHQLVNIVAAWLVSLHLSRSGVSLRRIERILIEGGNGRDGPGPPGAISISGKESFKEKDVKRP
jgi:glycosylphosphatidylinositol deacylase